MENIDIEYITGNRISERKLEELFVDEGEIFTLQDEDAEELIARIGKVIEAASSLVNGYCQARYSEVMPFSPVPGLVKELTLDIFELKAYARRGMVAEEVQTRHDNALKILKNIADGTLKLDVPETGAKVAENSIRFTNKTPDDRVFRNPQGYYT